MISKTIGYNGVHDIFRHTQIDLLEVFPPSKSIHFREFSIAGRIGLLTGNNSLSDGPPIYVNSSKRENTMTDKPLTDKPWINHQNLGHSGSRQMQNLLVFVVASHQQYLWWLSWVLAKSHLAKWSLYCSMIPCYYCSHHSYSIISYHIYIILLYNIYNICTHPNDII